MSDDNEPVTFDEYGGNDPENVIDEGIPPDDEEETEE